MESPAIVGDSPVCENRLEIRAEPDGIRTHIGHRAGNAAALVRYARHPLDIDEVRQHIEHGKLPTRLALTWDDRVSFVLTEGLQLRKIALLDAVMEGQSQDDGGFDADVAIEIGRAHV